MTTIIWNYFPINMSRTTVVCHLCSAVVSADSRAAHQTFHDTYIHKDKVKTMSSAAWCDPGNHAFKAGEPGSQHFQGSTVDENGVPQRVDMDACSLHSFGGPQESKTRALDARIADLEKENGIDL